VGSRGARPVAEGAGGLRDRSLQLVASFTIAKAPLDASPLNAPAIGVISTPNWVRTTLDSVPTTVATRGIDHDARARNRGMTLSLISWTNPEAINKLTVGAQNSSSIIGGSLFL